MRWAAGAAPEARRLSRRPLEMRWAATAAPEGAAHGGKVGSPRKRLQMRWAATAAPAARHLAKGMR